MEFNFTVSKSKTVHVTDVTLNMLEELQDELRKPNTKPMHYDLVIRLALKNLQLKLKRKAREE
jgi:hypothetical protein